MPVPSDHGPASPDRRKLLVAGAYLAANAAVVGQLGRGRGGRVRADGGTTVTDPGSVQGAPPAPSEDHTFDLVLRGGRVMDPDSGYDQVAHVGIDGEKVRQISTSTLKGRQVIDVAGKVVAPGFIDILSYEPDDRGAWFKVADGVTTNLGMHGINATSDDFFARYFEDCVVNYGGAFDDPWVRSTMFDLDPDDEASPDQIQAIAEEAERQLDAGWIGIDVEPEYAPGTTFAEMRALAVVAERYGVPVFVHGRYSAYGTNQETLTEIINLAKETGAAVHVEHITSTGGTWDMARSLATIDAANEQGYDVTACMYPYDFWATYLGSPRFNDGWQERFRITYQDLEVAGTGERLTADTFRARQRENLLVAAYAIPEQDVRTCLQHPKVMLGSDAILTNGNNHPRATGCFARTLGHYARETKTISLMAALAKMTILPARRLEARVPALQVKGRIQRGADADITVFDPATVIDRSTVVDPAQESAGIEHVLIRGQVIRTPEGNDESKKLGRPVTGTFT